MERDEICVGALCRYGGRENVTTVPGAVSGGPGGEELREAGPILAGSSP